MDRICRHYGVESASQFILMNYILATAGEGHGHVFAKVRHIPVNGSHLDKVAAVNQLSREIAEGKYTVSEAYQALETIRRMPDKRKKRADSGFRCSKRCFLLPFRGQSDGLSGGSHCRISDLCLYSLYQRTAFVKDCG